MNIRSTMKKLATQFNSVLRIHTPVHLNRIMENKFLPFAGGSVNSKCNNFLTQSLVASSNLNSSNSDNEYLVSKEKQVLFNSVIGDVKLPIFKEIIDPKKIEVDIELPLRNITNGNFDLPCNSNRELIEPVEKIISIKAKESIIRIRRRKMRKHKRKKFRKKWMVQIRKIKFKRKLKKKLKLKNFLRHIMEEGINFNAEKYLAKKLKIMDYVPPVTKARGRLAPQSVIKSELKKEADQNLVRQRIEYCIQQTE